MLHKQEGFAFSHCTTCKAPYYLRVHSHTDRKWRTLKFRFFVTRDILFIFALVQIVSFWNILLSISLIYIQLSDQWCFLIPSFRSSLHWHIWYILLMGANNIGWGQPGLLIMKLVFIISVVNCLIYPLLLLSTVSACLFDKKSCADFYCTYCHYDP
jgi:hypothetical protein